MQVAAEFESQECDLLIALHARKSAASIVRFREQNPLKPIVLVLTGTDLYRDILSDPSSQRSLDLADRLVVLQRDAVNWVPAQHRPRTRVIVQSVPEPGVCEFPPTDDFEVCVIGHLRKVKDPFRTAIAARSLPMESRIRVIHIGGAISDEMSRQATAEAETNPRYQWLGSIDHDDVILRLRRARLLSLTSEMEGGANVISEAIVCGTPVISSRISGSIGLLGADYPGFFETGNTEQLTALLSRAEFDSTFYQQLAEHCRLLKPMFDPKHESESLQKLVAELT